jgi:hypothetical protein
MEQQQPIRVTSLFQDWTPRIEARDRSAEFIPHRPGICCDARKRRRPGLSESLSGINSALLQHFLIGPGVGLGLILAVVIYIWFKRARDKAGKTEREEDAEGLNTEIAQLLGDDRKQRFKNAFLASTAFWIVAAIVVGILYSFSGNIWGYEGMVEGGRGRTDRSYHVTVGGKEYSTSKAVFEKAEYGDKIRKPLFMPYAYVEGERLHDTQTVWLIGFYLGVFGCGALYASLSMLRAAATQNVPQKKDDPAPEPPPALPES